MGGRADGTLPRSRGAPDNRADIASEERALLALVGETTVAERARAEEAKLIAVLRQTANEWPAFAVQLLTHDATLTTETESLLVSAAFTPFAITAGLPAAISYPSPHDELVYFRAQAGLTATEVANVPD